MKLPDYHRKLSSVRRAESVKREKLAFCEGCMARGINHCHRREKKVEVHAHPQSFEARLQASQLD